MNRIISTLLIVVAILSFAACDDKKDNTQSKITDTTHSAQALTGAIPLDELPLNIKEYIEQKYSGYKIEKATYDPLCSGENAIDVAIAKQNYPNLSLIFLLDGTFVQLEEDIELGKAPSKVMETIKTKYADYQPAAKIERLTLADNSIQFLVDLTKGNLTKEVILREDGAVVCER